jgi:hypothetical protein
MLLAQAPQFAAPSLRLRFLLPLLEVRSCSSFAPSPMKVWGCDRWLHPRTIRSGPMAGGCPNTRLRRALWILCLTAVKTSCARNLVGSDMAEAEVCPR